MAKQNIPQIVIKKYANRRLYNTSTSTYVTLDDLCNMVKKGIDFGVYDAKNGDDLTRSVLTQIIVEQEAKGTNLLPVSFLKKLISFYGGNMQMPVARYLEDAMHSFVNNQERIQRQWNDAIGMIPGMGAINEMSKQNMAVLEKTMRMFNPFTGEPTGGATPFPHAQNESAKLEAEYNKLRHQMDDLQRMIQGIKKSDKK
ncbi:MAG: polyhydroxyalkanoate synthesis repressor PhaR [Alphaproteobacteria bacterium]|nr:MAG: polyhydroxyalkanoate synthesis repressor PhaR [Alphaproteobacteria bacterium]